MGERLRVRKTRILAHSTDGVAGGDASGRVAVEADLQRRMAHYVNLRLRVLAEDDGQMRMDNGRRPEQDTPAEPGVAAHATARHDATGTPPPPLESYRSPRSARFGHN